MNFFRKVEETWNFRVWFWVMEKSYQHRRVSILPAGGSMGYFQLQGRWWTNVNNQAGQKRPVTCFNDFFSCHQQGWTQCLWRCLGTEPSIATSFMSIAAYVKYWVMDTVLVRFKELPWNAASALNRRCPWHAKIRRHFLVLVCKACTNLFLQWEGESISPGPQSSVSNEAGIPGEASLAGQHSPLCFGPEPPKL